MSLNFGTVDVVDANWVASEDVGHDIQVLFYEDGTVRVAHDCRSVVGTHGDARFRCAPRLQLGNGHEIVLRNPLTIFASILCDDCGLHGWVTRGEWSPA
ncbi:hypothetical protein BH09ACT9_BH09ACT9_00610 [soil metagenome]